jgi:uncharacterized protein YndB with AHSA1/START domain
MEPLELVFDVACSPQHAFDTWALDTARWWPASHSVSSDPGLIVTLEPWAGGRIFERTPSGDEHDWGQVLEWEPPERLAYSWHLRQDRDDATRVEITFSGSEQGTAVRIVHSGWERLGAKGSDLRDRNRASWDGLLPWFVEACEGAPA